MEPQRLCGIEPSYLTRFERVQQMHQLLWDRWHKEYIQTLVTRTKWTQEHPNFRVNDLVIVKEDNTAPLDWCTGRIIHTYPGKDGLVRSVTVRTKDGNYDRPITKLALLPSNLPPINTETGRTSDSQPEPEPVSDIEIDEESEHESDDDTRFEPRAKPKPSRKQPRSLPSPDKPRTTPLILTPPEHQDNGFSRVTRSMMRKPTHTA